MADSRDIFFFQRQKNLVYCRFVTDQQSANKVIESIDIDK